MRGAPHRPPATSISVSSCRPVNCPQPNARYAPIERCADSEYRRMSWSEPTTKSSATGSYLLRSRPRFSSEAALCMVDPKETLVRAWMAKARSDLGTARKVASGPDAYLDTAIYHCQQAAEKAIKALLVRHDLRFEKIHDL